MASVVKKCCRKKNAPLGGATCSDIEPATWEGGGDRKSETSRGTSAGSVRREGGGARTRDGSGGAMAAEGGRPTNGRGGSPRFRSPDAMCRSKCAAPVTLPIPGDMAVAWGERV